MDTFVVEIWDDEADRCTFYTVRWDEAEESETESFFNKYYEDDLHKEVAEQLYELITDTIGDRYGAIDKFFNRHEDEVNALPPKGKIRLGKTEIHHPNFPLRLYLLRINENIVVLFNGGIKNAQTTQESEGDISMKWREACAFAKQITEAIQEKMIEVNEKDFLLLNYKGGSEIVLP
jgi:hypothetical protein